MFSQKLRHRVFIQLKNLSQDIYGQPQDSWVPLTTAWAYVQELTGKEYFSAQATQNPITAKIILRPQSGITILPSMRVQFGTTFYNIEAVVHYSEREIHLLCTSGVKYV